MIMYVHVRGMDAYVQLGKGVKTEKMMPNASTEHESVKSSFPQLYTCGFLILTSTMLTILEKNTP